MPDLRGQNPWHEFKADHGPPKKKGGLWVVPVLVLLFALGGAAGGWFLASFGGESNRTSHRGPGPRQGESIERYNERFFNRGKIGAVIGAVVGAGFVIVTMREMKD